MEVIEKAKLLNKYEATIKRYKIKVEKLIDEWCLLLEIRDDILLKSKKYTIDYVKTKSINKTLLLLESELNTISLKIAKAERNEYKYTELLNDLINEKEN